MVHVLIEERISIAIIYGFASKTGALAEDPILWFTMMLMPVGPTAMNLTSLVDVAGSDEEEKLSMSKFLVISYAISPVLAFTVVGALKASQAAMG
jgi:nitrate reductase NapE component